jgi:hypothetical protein
MCARLQGPSEVTSSMAAHRPVPLVTPHTPPRRGRRPCPGSDGAETGGVVVVCACGEYDMEGGRETRATVNVITPRRRRARLLVQMWV